jgi:Dimerisation domain of Zinc Transporter
MRRSIGGLMDRALDEPARRQILAVLSRFERDGVRLHAQRTRQAGSRAFVELHVLVPGAWSVQRGLTSSSRSRSPFASSCATPPSLPASNRPGTRGRSTVRPWSGSRAGGSQRARVGAIARPALMSGLRRRPVSYLERRVDRCLCCARLLATCPVRSGSPGAVGLIAWTERLAAFVESVVDDDESGERVGPPPIEGGVGDQAE